jgi:protocatechuate 3,4-dioxygenase beta subunit
VRLFRQAFSGLIACVLANAAFGYDISVLVFDLQGQPVPGASVWLTQDRIPKHVTTGADGHCQFPDVGIGPVEVVAWKEGFAVGGRDARVVGSAEIAIALGEPGILAVTLVSRGRDPSTGEKSKPEPVEGARVETMLVNDAFSIAVDELVALGFPSARSDANGHLAIDYVPRGGHVTIRVSHRRFCDKYVHYPVGQREITVQMFEGLPLRGRVTNETGEGIAHARVAIFKTQENETALREFEEATTDPDGFYRVLLPPGEYHVTAKHPDYATAEPISGTLHVQDADAVCDLILPTAYTLAGRVVGTDGQPVGGVRLQYVVNDVVYEQTLTSNAGIFALKVAPSEGRLHVVAPDGYMTDRGTDIDVKMNAADVSIEKPIRLQVLPEISGTVSDENGAPVASAFVSTVDFEPAQFVLTDAAGRFAMQLPRVPADAVALLRIEHPLRFMRAELVIPLTDLAPLDVKLVAFEPNLTPCDPAHVLNAPLDALRGKTAPPIACNLWLNVPFDTGGQPVAPTPESLRGKVVVLSFWGGFDQSVEGSAHVRALSTLFPIFSEMGDVALLGVHDVGTEEHELEEYIQELVIPYPVGRDEEAATTYDAYDIMSIPQIVLIDKKGVLRYYDVEGRLLELVKSLRREGS